MQDDDRLKLGNCKVFASAGCREPRREDATLLTLEDREQRLEPLSTTVLRLETEEHLLMAGRARLGTLGRITDMFHEANNEGPGVA
mmetsp:Transcript_94521/g.167407  ORF Transcript_94521/g.167407 Transcript_94521/m.167407 type:complete len:86 (-) Transcript_94521:7-264(-)